MKMQHDETIVSGARMVPEPAQLPPRVETPRAPPKPRDRWSGFTDAERDAVEVALRLYIQARNPEKRQRYNHGVPVGPGSEAITWGHAVDVLATIKKII